MNQTTSAEKKPLTPTASLLHIPQIWWQTVTNTRVYRSLIHLSLPFGLTYSFLLYGVLAVGSTLIFAFQTTPQLENRAIATWEELRTAWPAELVVRYDDSQLRFENIAQPLVVPYPTSFTGGESLPENLAYIDTRTLEEQGVSTESELLENIDQPVAFAITRTHLLLQPTPQTEITDSNSATWENLLGPQTTTVTAEDVAAADESVRHAAARILTFLTIPYFFLAWIGVWSIRVLLLLLYAFFGQTVFWIFGTRIRYAAVFRLGLFTLPVVEMVPLIWRALYGPLGWTGAFWWIWLAFIAFLAWDNRKGRILSLESL